MSRTKYSCSKSFKIYESQIGEANELNSLLSQFLCIS